MSDLKTAFELELLHDHSTARTRERLSPEWGIASPQPC